MRRRPIILLLCATAGLVGAAIALADAPGTGPAVKALAESPDAQVGPSVAVNPAGGSPNILAAIAGTDWRNGASQPMSVSSSGSIVSGTGATTWAAQASLPHSGPDVSRGAPDIAWGPGNKVYAVEVDRDTANTSDPCQTGAGIYLLVSNNGGATWGPELEIAPNGPPGQSNSDPSIAYDASSGRIYIAYTKTDPCTAAPGDPGSTSQVRLVTLFRDDAVGGTPISPIPQGPSAVNQMRPSVVALPNGQVGIAYYDASTNPGDVLFTTCSAPVGPPPGKPACGSPVTIDDSARDPGSSALPGVQVRPSAAADSSGRVVVTWSEMTDNGNMDVFSATSRDSGADFGPPQPVPTADVSGNQINPTVTIAPDGRADLAFLDSRYNPPGYEVAVSASARPSGSSTSEAWSPSVPVESTPITPVAPYVPGQATIGDRLAIAEITRVSGPAWTLIAWTDTRNANGGTPNNKDVYSTVLMHGTTAPVAQDMPPVDVQRNIVTPVVIVGATDADADPLTYSITQGPAQGTATVPDANKPLFNYTAPDTLGTQTVRIGISDGLHQSTMTATLHVVNSPPTIACSQLQTPVDTALPIPPDCATDPNHDQVTLDASSPVHGTIQRAGGAISFVPESGFEGSAQVTLTASDGIDTATKTITIIVGAAGETPVTIAGETNRAAFTDRPITLAAASPVLNADLSKVAWSIDGKATDIGKSMSHLFPKVGTYQVTAQIGSGHAAKITVYVQKPPLTITRTTLARNGLMGLRVKLANSGKLTAGLVGVRGMRHLTMKLKKGTHSIHMRLPASVRTRGTVILKLSLTLANGGTKKVTRAVLVPAP